MELHLGHLNGYRDGLSMRGRTEHVGHHLRRCNASHRKGWLHKRDSVGHWEGHRRLSVESRLAWGYGRDSRWRDAWHERCRRAECHRHWDGGGEGLLCGRRVGSRDGGGLLASHRLGHLLQPAVGF